MFITTNDVYDDAVRGSILRNQEEETQRASVGAKIATVLLLTGMAYIGFKYYTETIMVNEALVVKQELVAQIQTESEVRAEAIMPPISTQVIASQSYSDSEEEYLRALKGIESELTAERESVSLDTTEQLDLSSAMSELLDDVTLADNSSYTKGLRKELGIEEKKEVKAKKQKRVVVVKKGDTLQSLSSKFYGDAQNYKRIIASNANLNSKGTIYVGQTILLPY